MSKTVKINKKTVPCKDVIRIRQVFVSDQIMYEVTYRLFEPCYHEVNELLSKEDGYKAELTVRRACQRR